MNDLTVKINIPLEIKFIHRIEKQLDMALIPMGFTRETTTKNIDTTEINYRQFGIVI